MGLRLNHLSITTGHKTKPPTVIWKQHENWRGFQNFTTKVFSQSLEHFFLTVSQNNFVNKIPSLLHQILKSENYEYCHVRKSPWQRRRAQWQKWRALKLNFYGSHVLHYLHSPHCIGVKSFLKSDTQKCLRPLWFWGIFSKRATQIWGIRILNFYHKSFG